RLVPERNNESRAFSQLACNGRVPAHGFGELPYNREAESCPAMLACDCVVGLDKGREEPLARLFVHARARIADLNCQLGTVAAVPRMSQNTHPALVGELDRVRNKIGDALLNAHSIKSD